MKKQIKINKKSLVRWKVYFDRSKMYISYLQTVLIVVMFIQGFKDKPWASIIFEYSLISLPIIFVVFVGASLILGYLDSKFGFREEEQRNLSRSNPVMMEILDSIKDIKSDIAELKKPQ
jgi:hypothetical protein